MAYCLSEGCSRLTCKGEVHIKLGYRGGFNIFQFIFGGRGGLVNILFGGRMIGFELGWVRGVLAYFNLGGG